MSQDNAARETSPVVQLFQDAHQKMVMLKRVEEQMAQLQVRRRTLMDELRQVQTNINDEFDRMFSAAGGAQQGDVAPRMQSISAAGVSRHATFRDVQEQAEEEVLVDDEAVA